MNEKLSMITIFFMTESSPLSIFLTLDLGRLLPRRIYNSTMTIRNTKSWLNISRIPYWSSWFSRQEWFTPPVSFRTKGSWCNYNYDLRFYDWTVTELHVDPPGPLVPSSMGWLMDLRPTSNDAIRTLTYDFMTGSLQSSTLILLVLSSSLVWATFIGCSLSWIAFLNNSMFLSMSKISCMVYKTKEWKI